MYILETQPNWENSKLKQYMQRYKPYSFTYWYWYIFQRLQLITTSYGVAFPTPKCVIRFCNWHDHQVWLLEHQTVFKMTTKLFPMIFTSSSVLYNILCWDMINIVHCFKGVLHPRPVFGLFLHFSLKLQHIGNK